MMPTLLFGVVLLVAVVYFLRWYGTAKTEDVKKALRIGGITVGILIVLVLAVTGRLGAALGFLAVLFGWAWRAFNMIQMGRQMSGMFKGFARNVGGGKSNTSQVESAFLSMTLDHDTGHLDGQVTQGRFVGRGLSTLAFEDLMTLAGEVRADAESAALLESYLDRAHPDWRERGGENTQGPTRPASMTMTEDEALQILGLAKGAGPDDIKSAYRRLMAQVHPDKGGTDYLAAKINAAKDFLLGS
jgi:hypothetical protein